LQNAKTQKSKKHKKAKKQKHKKAKTQKGAKSIFPIDKENAHILQRINEGGESGHWSCASLTFSISYGQAKEMATNYGSHLSNVLSFSFNIG